MKLVHLKWIDSTAREGVWTENPSFNAVELVCDTVGRVCEENDEVITVYLSHHQNTSYAGSMSIPKAAIIERYEITVPD